MASGGTFNCTEWESWYFERLSRVETQNKLLGQPHGTFLVRDSMTCPGDYVLSVSENSKVSHYIINKTPNILKIGDQTFSSMSQLLEFYKVHYLDTTTLITPLWKNAAASSTPQALSASSNNVLVNRISQGFPDNSHGDQVQETEHREKVFVQGLYDFESEDPDDLRFRKGEILEVIEKPEENWWTARNKDGRIGQIPVPYVGSIAPGRNSISVNGNYQLPPMVCYIYFKEAFELVC